MKANAFISIGALMVMAALWGGSWILHFTIPTVDWWWFPSIATTMLFAACGWGLAIHGLKLRDSMS